MKKIFSLFLACLFSVIIYGQSVQEKRGVFRINKLIQSGVKFPVPKTSLKSFQNVKLRLDSAETEVWYESTNQWVSFDKAVYTYDEYNNNIQTIIQDNDPFYGGLLKMDKEEYVYDTDGKILQKIESSFHETIGQWNEHHKLEYNYNINKNLILELMYYMENTQQWVLSTKWEYSYNDDELINHKIYYYLNKNTSIWEPKTKAEYIHDVNDNIVQTIHFLWNVTEGQWVNSSKRDYIFDENQNVLQHYYYVWYKSTNQWLKNWLIEYVYDNHLNITVVSDYDWEEMTSQWLPANRIEFKYDNTYSFPDLMLPYNFISDDEIKMFFNNHPLTSALVYNYDSYTNDFSKESKWTLYYSEQNTTSVTRLYKNTPIVYPNPFSEYVSFNFNSTINKIVFKLYDIQGRELMTLNIKNTEKIKLDGLTKGVYIYYLYIDDKIQRGKLIKK